MNLKLTIQATGQSWVLEPSRDYIAGSDRSSDIDLSAYPDVAGRHLRLSCDRISNTWYVQDLDTSVGTYIDGEAISRSLIEQATSITLAKSVIISAQPLAATPIVPPPQSYRPEVSGQSSSSYRTEDVRNPGFREDTQPVRRAEFSNYSTSQSGSGLRNFSWSDYVKAQESQYDDFAMRLITRYALLTGLRKTPWMNQADGFIIPNFQGSLDTVIQKIENSIGELKQYEDTDCITAQLTDAHIADSEKGFPGIELFSIRRGKNATRGDYRRFCITSYHRIRTYLLVEKYGSDLFVTWITRFEPTPISIVMILWLIVAILVTLTSLATGNPGIIMFPLVIWSEVYILVPNIMASMGILPKKSNALLVMGIVISVSVFLLMLFAGYSAFSSTRSRYGL